MSNYVSQSSTPEESVASSNFSLALHSKFWMRLEMLGEEGRREGDKSRWTGEKIFAGNPNFSLIVIGAHPITK